MRNLFLLALGGFFTALVAGVFAISFATMIYSGPLAPYLDRGAGLILTGVVILAVMGALTLSFRGSILGSQDVPAILIAAGLGPVLAQGDLPPEILFATIACLIAVTSLTTGVLALAVGAARAAYVARFFPYPVLAGFLATTGLFLFLGGVDIAVGGADLIDLLRNPDPATILKLGPVVFAAVAATVATRMLQGAMVLPGALIAMLLGFYGFYMVVGLSFDDLRAGGFLVGPFEAGGFTQAWDPTLPLRADWGLIAQQAPLILTVAVSALIGTTLNTSGLELALERDLDANRDVAGVGLANILSGLVGGVPGYHFVGQTLLANRLGVEGALAGFSAAAGAGLVLVLGASALTVLPIGFFAAVVAYLGLDLVYRWLWKERRHLRLSDYGVVLLIPLVAVSFGFLTAIALGLLCACVLFVVDYGKLDVVRLESNLATRRSLVERPDVEIDVLAANGHTAKVIELSSFLFFGSASAIRERAQAILEANPDLRWMLLDFRRTPGIDVSVRHILRRIHTDCDAQGVTLVLSGLPDGLDRQQLAQTDGIAVFDTLGDGLQHLEAALLAESPVSSREGLSPQLLALVQQPGLEDLIEEIRVAEGDTVIAEDDTSNEIFLLKSGLLRVVTPDARGRPTVIAYIRAGRILGEMAYYAGQSRSASIVADAPSELIRIDASQLDRLEETHPQLTAAFHRLVAAEMAQRLTRTAASLRVLAD